MSPRGTDAMLTQRLAGRYRQQHPSQRPKGETLQGVPIPWKTGKTWLICSWSHIQSTGARYHPDKAWNHHLHEGHCTILFVQDVQMRWSQRDSEFLAARGFLQNQCHPYRHNVTEFRMKCQLFEAGFQKSKGMPRKERETGLKSPHAGGHPTSAHQTSI